MAIMRFEILAWKIAVWGTYRHIMVGITATNVLVQWILYSQCLLSLDAIVVVIVVVIVLIVSTIIFVGPSFIIDLFFIPQLFISPRYRCSDARLKTFLTKARFSSIAFFISASLSDLLAWTKSCNISWLDMFLRHHHPSECSQLFPWRSLQSFGYSDGSTTM